MNAAIPVPFRSSTLYVVDSGGEPFVPMKPIVEGMGLDWKSQHAKLAGSRFCMVEITTQLPGDTQRRAVSCVPLRKLPGWLMTIYPNKVRPEVRNSVIAYQEQSDDILWAAWNGSHAAFHGDDGFSELQRQQMGLTARYFEQLAEYRIVLCEGGVALFVRRPLLSIRRRPLRR